MDKKQPLTSVCTDSYESITEETKKEWTDAVYLFVNALKEKGVLNSEASSSISMRSKLMSERILQQFWEMQDEMMFADLQELLFKEETEEGEEEEKQEGEQEEENDEIDMLSPHSSFASQSDYNYEPVNKKLICASVPLDVKIKAVTLMKEHPKWNLRTLQKKGATCSLKRKKDLSEWEKDIEKGGTNRDKYASIDKWTFDRFVEARQRNEHVTTRILQQWASSAALQYTTDTDFKFNASLSWTKNFKQKHRIRQRHVTKYVSFKDTATFEDTLKAADFFQKQTASLISTFDHNYVINTDQTGCEYRINIRRTLSHRGEKKTLVAVGSINKVTHSYTAQYSITASGKLLPTVFLCLQEPSGKFGPKVTEEVNRLTDIYKNLYVTCSKSGKLTTNIYKLYLQYVLKPYVENNNFCLIVDSWGGQTDMVMYDTMFTNDQKQPTCTLKIIPAKCTPLCQPCDVYFYRQVKNFISKFQNCSTLLDKQRELHNRTDAITIHSLIHNQLSAPIFQPMLSYAWYASKLITTRRIFMNVNQICFPSTIGQAKCVCAKIAFIHCAWCRKFICFECFYDNYHPMHCELRQLESESE